MLNRKTITALGLFAAFCLLTALPLAAAEMPSTVIHVITVKWKDEATPDQINAALKGVEQLAKDYPGIKRVWVKTLKVQGPGYKNAIVMEFANEKALADYANSAAQKKWYEVYLPIRAESRSHDITN